jgi:hypothetical protein
MAKSSPKFSEHGNPGKKAKEIVVLGRKIKSTLKGIIK